MKKQVRVLEFGKPVDRRKVAALQKVLDGEPDRKTFYSSGYKCKIIRVPGSLHLSGYVGVPKGNPLFRADAFKSFFRVNGVKSAHSISSYLGPHGGVNYSHLWEDGLWYFGFDCAHGEDICPGTILGGDLFGWKTYHTFPFVEKECRKLAKQIAELSNQLKAGGVGLLFIVNE